MASDSEAGAATALSPAAGRWVLLATICASSMVFIDGTALNVALPAMQTELQARATHMLWVINGYWLVLGALLLVGGALGDKYGRRRMYGWGIAAFSLASAAAGLAPTIGVLIAARVLQGIGGALLVPGSLAIIAATFPASKRGAAIGLWSAFSTVTTSAGPVVGGVLAQAGLWRVVFFINLPLAVAALIVLYRAVPETRDEQAPERLDWLGAALATCALGGVVYGFTTASESGFRDPLVVAALTLGVLALAGFVLVEARAAHPMLPLGLFRSPTFTGANLLTLFLYGALLAFVVLVNLNLIQLQGYRPDLAGLTVLPMTALLTVLSWISGRLVDRLGARPFLVIGPALAGLALLLCGRIGMTAGPSEYWTTFLPPLLLFGAGMGLTVAPLSTAVMGAVPSRSAGIASGVNNAVSRVAGVLALAVIGSLALIHFTGAVEEGAAALRLGDEQRTAVLAEAADFGEAAVPAAVAPEQRAAVSDLYRESFAAAFALAMLICAGLAWLGALLAAFLIRPARSGAAEGGPRAAGRADDDGEG